MFKTDTCCTLVPYFEVQDGQLAAFKALGPQFVERTRTEPGCVHYAFSFNGNTAHCREGYDHAEAVLAVPLNLSLEVLQGKLEALADLAEHDGNISATARALKMHRRTLQRKLAKRPSAE